MCLQFLVDLYVSEPHVADVLHSLRKLFASVALEVVGVREGGGERELIVTIALVSHKAREALEAGSHLIDAVTRGRVLHPGLYLAAPAYLDRPAAARKLAAAPLIPTPSESGASETELEDELEAANARLASELRSVREANEALRTQVAAFAAERHDWALFRDQWGAEKTQLDADKADLKRSLEERHAVWLEEKTLRQQEGDEVREESKELRAQVVSLRAELQDAHAEVEKLSAQLEAAIAADADAQARVEEIRGLQAKLDAATAAQKVAEAAEAAQQLASKKTIDEQQANLAASQAAQAQMEATSAAERQALECTIDELRLNLGKRQADWHAERDELLLRVEGLQQRCHDAERSAAPTASPPEASEASPPEASEAGASWQQERKLLQQQLADLRSEMDQQRRQSADELQLKREHANLAQVQWCPVGLEGQLVLKMEKAARGGSPQPMTTPSGAISIVSSYDDRFDSKLGQHVEPWSKERLELKAAWKEPQQLEMPRSAPRANPIRTVTRSLWSMEAIEGHL